MKNISKYFKSLKQAERFHNKLYDQYDYVRAIRSPLFSEEGTYVWQVDTRKVESPPLQLRTLTDET